MKLKQFSLKSGAATVLLLGLGFSGLSWAHGSADHSHSDHIQPVNIEFCKSEGSSTEDKLETDYNIKLGKDLAQLSLKNGIPLGIQHVDCSGFIADRYNGSIEIRTSVFPNGFSEDPRDYLVSSHMIRKTKETVDSFSYPFVLDDVDEAFSKSHDFSFDFKLMTLMHPETLEFQKNGEQRYEQIKLFVLLTIMEAAGASPEEKLRLITKIRNSGDLGPQDFRFDMELLMLEIHNSEKSGNIKSEETVQNWIQKLEQDVFGEHFYLKSFEALLYLKVRYGVESAEELRPYFEGLKGKYPADLSSVSEKDQYLLFVALKPLFE